MLVETTHLTQVEWRTIFRLPPNFMKFSIRGQLTDVITCVKFKFLGVLTPQNMAFAIDLQRR